ncbi:hypothetical protein [Actinomadura chokoriensis]|uniref:hypothetical protein n=1 Tax=Actinomadura chokoriensis TaxID=454156 RepID=UPI0031F7A068
MASPRTLLIGVSALALTGGTVLGLTGVSTSAAPAAPPHGARLQAADAQVAAAIPKVTRAASRRPMADTARTARDTRP